MSIFEFNDSRPYLREFIAHLPRKGRGEAKRIAEHLGVSTTLVSQVLAGQKSFTPEQGQKLAEYLGLPEVETDHLSFMIQHERAGTIDLKKYWRKKLEDLRARALKLSERVKAERVLNDEERAIFYSNAIYSAVRLYTSIGQGKSMAEICERFELPRARATEILNFLASTGLCRLENDRYMMGAQSTHLPQGSPHLAKHHANWRLRALQRGDDLTDQELMYSVVVSLAKRDFEILREKMVADIKAFLKQVHDSPAEEVACFNLDFFWVKR